MCWHPSDFDFVQQDQVLANIDISYNDDDDDDDQVSEHPGPHPRVLLSARGPGDNGGDVPDGHHQQCQCHLP